jgi:hypothetical protein
MYREKLINISKCIIASKSSREEIQAAKDLSDFFSQFFLHEDEMPQQTKHTETIIPGGVALSPSDAAICLDDYLRTSRFIKASYLAIQELLLTFPNQKINILYAGCGPYATILMPLLPLLNKEDISIVLLDINAYSIQSANKLMKKLDLTDYSVQVLQANAITYKQPESKPLHLVITETMFRALIREPQVAITANLAPQLCSGGILIPEEIKLSMHYSSFAKEPYLKSVDKDFLTLEANLPDYDEPAESNTLFSMNKNDNFSNKISHHTYQFESDSFELPKEFSNRPDICIYTNVRIFKGLTLNSAESYITNPYCVTSLFNLMNHTYFKLIYHFKDIPSWTYQLK